MGSPLDNVLSLFYSSFHFGVSKRNSFHRSTAASVHDSCQGTRPWKILLTSRSSTCSRPLKSTEKHVDVTRGCGVDQQDPASSSNTRHSMAKHLLPSCVQFGKTMRDGSCAVFLCIGDCKPADSGILDCLIGLCGASTRAQRAMSQAARRTRR